MVCLLRDQRWDSNIVLANSSVRCEGHGDKKHSTQQLVKTNCSHLLSYSNNLIHALIGDMKIALKDFTQHSDVEGVHVVEELLSSDYWACKKCKLGSKHDGDHTLVPGQCKLAPKNDVSLKIAPDPLQPGQKVSDVVDEDPNLEASEEDLTKRFGDICLNDVNMILGDQVIGDVLI